MNPTLFGFEPAVQTPPAKREPKKGIPKLDPPKNQKAAILKLLIESNFVSERDTSYNGFRARICDLKKKHHLPIKTKWTKFTTEFGKQGQYHEHCLMTIDKGAAIVTYNQINK